MLSGETPEARPSDTLPADDRLDGPGPILRVGTATGDVVVPDGERSRIHVDGATDAAPSSALAWGLRGRPRLAGWPLVPLRKAADGA